MKKGDKVYVIETDPQMSVPTLWHVTVTQIRDNGQRVAYGGAYSKNLSEVYMTLEDAAKAYEARLLKYRTELASLDEKTSETLSNLRKGLVRVLGSNERRLP